MRHSPVTKRATVVMFLVSAKRNVKWQSIRRFGEWGQKRTEKQFMLPEVDNMQRGASTLIA